MVSSIGCRVMNRNMTVQQHRANNPAATRPRIPPQLTEEPYKSSVGEMAGFVDVECDCELSVEDCVFWVGCVEVVVVVVVEVVVVVLVVVVSSVAVVAAGGLGVVVVVVVVVAFGVAAVVVGAASFLVVVVVVVVVVLAVVVLAEEAGATTPFLESPVSE